MPGLVLLCFAARFLPAAKTNLAEWAFSNQKSLGSVFGTTRNPYDLNRVTTGSSGGTAGGVCASYGMIGLVRRRSVLVLAHEGLHLVVHCICWVTRPQLTMTLALRRGTCRALTLATPSAAPAATRPWWASAPASASPAAPALRRCACPATLEVRAPAHYTALHRLLAALLGSPPSEECVSDAAR